jgi:dissimilatory sulfite reductase (desulfoviridin) alpha/beta subunit
LLLRWVPFDHLLDVREELVALGLGRSNAGGLGDTVACPGAYSCKLGITSPGKVARALEPTLDELAKNPRLEALTIKISGCPNSCAQHHVADIGFFGAARTKDRVVAPHYILILGGLAGGRGTGSTLGDGFGRAILKVPAVRLGEAVERLLNLFLEEAEPDEAFGSFATRLGRKRFKALLADLTELPSPSAAPELYREPDTAEPFEIVRGVGECAGAVVLASGWPPHWPAAAVERISHPDQRSVTATLESLPERLERERIAAPAVLVFGRVVGLAEEAAVEPIAAAG